MKQFIRPIRFHILFDVLFSMLSNIALALIL